MNINVAAEKTVTKEIDVAWPERLLSATQDQIESWASVQLERIYSQLHGIGKVLPDRTYRRDSKQRHRKSMPSACDMSGGLAQQMSSFLDSMYTQTGKSKFFVSYIVDGQRRIDKVKWNNRILGKRGEF